MDLIDTHCHLTFEQLAGDIDNVLARSRDAGITEWITIGTDINHNLAAVEMAQNYDKLYAGIGVHPHDAKHVTGKTISQLKELAQHEKVVAIGETGLDFHYNLSEQPDQVRAFTSQLQIAYELNLPVIIHSRAAFDETMDILSEFLRLKGSLRSVVFHCFSGTAEQAKKVLGYGFHISLTGVVTFKNANTLRQVAQLIPLDKLMLETDCPYMSPEPMRKQKVNEPALMIHTARFLAELKGMNLPEFAEAVTATSKAFFGLP